MTTFESLKTAVAEECAQQIIDLSEPGYAETAVLCFDVAREALSRRIQGSFDAAWFADLLVRRPDILDLDTVGPPTLREALEDAVSLLAYSDLAPRLEATAVEHGCLPSIGMRRSTDSSEEQETNSVSNSL